jgi:hypothetical protein
MESTPGGAIPPGGADRDPPSARGPAGRAEPQRPPAPCRLSLGALPGCASARGPAGTVGWEDGCLCRVPGDAGGRRGAPRRGIVRGASVRGVAPVPVEHLTAAGRATAPYQCMVVWLSRAERMAWSDHDTRGQRVGLLPARGNILGGMLQPPAPRRLMTSHGSGRGRTHGMEAAERDNPSPIGRL